MIQVVDDEAKLDLVVIMMGKYSHAYREEVSENRVQVYFERLKRYPMKRLEKAMEEALDNEFRFPSIAAIRQYIEPLLDPSRARIKYPDL